MVCLSIFVSSFSFRVVRFLPLHLLRGDVSDLWGDRTCPITHYTKFRLVIIAAALF